MISIIIFTTILTTCKTSRTKQSEYFIFDNYARQIHHHNSEGYYTHSLTWDDIRALNIDSLTVQYIKYHSLKNKKQ